MFALPRAHRPKPALDHIPKEHTALEDYSKVVSVLVNVLDGLVKRS
jgi:hypothetical protein